MPSRLTGKEVQRHWERYFDTRSQHDFETLYVSIPVCAEHCKFCIYYRNSFAGKSQLDEYLNRIEEEAQNFSRIFSGTTIKALYVGGGTPSLLSADQIRRLFDILHDNFNIGMSDGHFRCFEAHPLYMNRRKVDALLKDGLINRLSFGIQSFTESITEQNGRRYTSPDKLAQLLAAIRDEYSTIKLNINADLMIGLTESELEIRSVCASFKFLSEMDVHRISLYCNRLRETSALDTAFRDLARKGVQTLDRYVGIHHPQYTKLNDDPNACHRDSPNYRKTHQLDIYHENHAWGKVGFASKTYDYCYNSSPLWHNSNLGLGSGATSFIPSLGFGYDRIGEFYRRNENIVSDDHMIKMNYREERTSEYRSHFSF